MSGVPARAYTKIVVTSEGAVLRVALHNPARKNAIGPLMVNELLWALDDAQAAEDVRVIVVTGSGDAFCAGGDFAQMSGGAADELALGHRGDYADLLLAMTRASKPIVARVNGAAMGGGLGIVAASHFAIADADAKLGTPEIDVGLFPMMIMAVLARIVPQRKLLSMMLLGEKLKGSEAAALGLVSKAVTKDELDGEVNRLVESLASKSPAAVRLGLRAWADQADASLEQALPMLRDRLAEILGTDDAREGLTAFLEKRAPRWTGK